MSVSRIILIVKESSEQLRMSTYVLSSIYLLRLLLFTPLFLLTSRCSSICQTSSSFPLNEITSSVPLFTFLPCSFLRVYSSLLFGKKEAFIRSFVCLFVWSIRQREDHQGSLSVPEKWARAWKSFRLIKIQKKNFVSVFAFFSDWWGVRGSLVYSRKMRLLGELNGQVLSNLQTCDKDIWSHFSSYNR